MVAGVYISHHVKIWFVTTSVTASLIVIIQPFIYLKKTERERDRDLCICFCDVLAAFVTMNQSGPAVEVTKDRNGILQVVLRNPRGASARVSLYGGQVLSWRTDRGEELLFASTKVTSVLKL